jgi:hypothetical protein
MKLLDVYEAILEYATMKVDKSGFIKNAYGSGNESILIEGKQLVMPYDQQLRNFNPSEKMIFHPMAENIFKGESVVISLLKQKIMTKINISTCYLLQTLINILASPDLHNQMNPQQAELFNMGMDADMKTLTNFVKIMTHAVKNKPDKGFVSLYLNRGASYQGKRCTRVSVVSFPFYEQLTKEKETPNGLPVDHLRIKDKECLQKMFEFVFPDLDKQESYNYGSNNSTIPYLDVLMFGSAKITARINDLVEIYKDYIDENEQCMFASDWLDAMRDIDSLKAEILRIPVQYGSDGSLTPKAPAEPEPVQAAVQMMPQMSTMPVQQPKPQAPANKNGKVSFEQATQSNGQFVPQQMPMAYDPYGRPVQPMPMQQMPMQPMGVVYDSYGRPMQMPMQGHPQQMPVQQQMHGYPPQFQQPIQQQQIASQQNGWPQPAMAGNVRYPGTGYY